jgi:hypothetical protein
LTGAQQATVNQPIPQPQQQQHPGMVAMAPGLPNQQQQTPTQQQQPTVGFPQPPYGGGVGGMPVASNPYSQKTPGVTLARPPSASLYQQGYK